MCWFSFFSLLNASKHRVYHSAFIWSILTSELNLLRLFAIFSLRKKAFFKFPAVFSLFPPPLIILGSTHSTFSRRRPDIMSWPQPPPYNPAYPGYPAGSVPPIPPPPYYGQSPYPAGYFPPPAGYCPPPVQHVVYAGPQHCPPPQHHHGGIIHDLIYGHDHHDRHHHGDHHHHHCWRRCKKWNLFQFSNFPHFFLPNTAFSWYPVQMKKWFWWFFCRVFSKQFHGITADPLLTFHTNNF